MSEASPNPNLLEENQRLQAQNQALQSRINELEQIRRHLEHTVTVRWNRHGRQAPRASAEPMLAEGAEKVQWSAAGLRRSQF